jgi:hypothetical protein
MRAAFVVAGAIAACAPSDADIRTAKSTIYNGNADQIFQMAEQGAMDENYKIGPVDAGHLMFETEGHFYSATGDRQSEGAEGYVKVDNHSVKVSFIVVVDEVGASQYVVSVKPRTWQYLAGSPQMRELDPADPSLPPWVLGRADHLQLAIYDRTRGFVVAAPGSAQH